MGSAMARVLFDIERPTVGLLNIGVEEVKGLEQVREAGRILREAISAVSTIRASSKATVSARARSTSSSPKASPATSRSKTAEGTARQIRAVSARRDEPDLARAASATCSRSRAFAALREKMDPRTSNRRRLSRPQRRS